MLPDRNPGDAKLLRKCLARKITTTCSKSFQYLLLGFVNLHFLNVNHGTGFCQLTCCLTISITLHIINAWFKGRLELKQMERGKACFVNDPTRSRADGLSEAIKF
jgi:hypothetical protein